MSTEKTENILSAFSSYRIKRPYAGRYVGQSGSEVAVVVGHAASVYTKRRGSVTAST